MYLFIVTYSESNYDPETIVKVFDSNKKAVNFIDNMYKIPAVNKDGYSNDDYWNPDYLFIDTSHILE